MKIIYVADDGTQFDNEFDCEFYEWKLKHPCLKEICMFDKDGNRLEDILSEDTYNLSMKIIIPSDEAVECIQALADYTGYCAYESIDQIGEWVFDERKDIFVNQRMGK